MPSPYAQRPRSYRPISSRTARSSAFTRLLSQGSGRSLKLLATVVTGVSLGLGTAWFFVPTTESNVILQPSSIAASQLVAPEADRTAAPGENSGIIEDETALEGELDPEAQSTAQAPVVPDASQIYADEEGLTNPDGTMAIESDQPEPEPNIMVEGLVEPGDSIYRLLAAHGLNGQQIHRIVQQLKGTFSTRDFRPGKPWKIEKRPDGSFLSFSYQPRTSEIIHIDYIPGADVGEDFRVSREVRDYELATKRLDMQIDSSLSRALARSGGSAQLAVELENIFAWKIDFRRDIAPGTRLQVVYEEKQIDGISQGIGRVLAARIENRYHQAEAYYFRSADSSGYYDAKGESLRRFFLKKPTEYRRVSSSFGYRTHPITRARHFHGGVDLAAPAGTPVYATAEGTIIWRGYKSLAGNMVTIRHANGYHTKYLHLSRFARGLRSGSTVEQGEVIGYIGSTGRSTGPHLDYRVAKNGKYINPMRLPAHSVEPVPESQMTAFREQQQLYLAALESPEQVMRLASLH